MSDERCPKCGAEQVDEHPFWGIKFACGSGRRSNGEFIYHCLNNNTCWERQVASRDAQLATLRESAEAALEAGGCMPRRTNTGGDSGCESEYTIDNGAIWGFDRALIKLATALLPQKTQP